MKEEKTVSDKINALFIFIGLLIVANFIYVFLFFYKIDNLEESVYNKKLKEEYQLFDRYAFEALSSLINSEADPNDPMDLYLIGSTVLNRADHELYPSCVIDVIFEKGQYDGVNGNFKRTPQSDSIAFKLLSDLGRNREVLFFYNYHKATDKKFIRFLEKKCKLITVTKNHKFYGL